MKDKKLREFLGIENNSWSDTGKYGRIIERLNKLEDDHKRTLKEKEIVTCEICGCLLEKKDAIQGKAEVRKRFLDEGQSGEYAWVTVNLFGGTIKKREEEYIYYPYYCKKCGKK